MHFLETAQSLYEEKLVTYSGNSQGHNNVSQKTVLERPSVFYQSTNGMSIQNTFIQLSCAIAIILHPNRCL